MPEGKGYEHLGGMSGKAAKALSGRAAKLAAAEAAAMGKSVSRSNDSTSSQRSAADIAKDKK